MAELVLIVLDQILRSNICSIFNKLIQGVAYSNLVTYSAVSVACKKKAS